MAEQAQVGRRQLSQLTGATGRTLRVGPVAARMRFLICAVSIDLSSKRSRSLWICWEQAAMPRSTRSNWKASSGFTPATISVDMPLSGAGGEGLDAVPAPGLAAEDAAAGVKAGVVCVVAQLDVPASLYRGLLDESRAHVPARLDAGLAAHGPGADGDVAAGDDAGPASTVPAIVTSNSERTETPRATDPKTKTSPPNLRFPVWKSTSPVTESTSTTRISSPSWRTIPSARET